MRIVLNAQKSITPRITITSGVKKINNIVVFRCASPIGDIYCMFDGGCLIGVSIGSGSPQAASHRISGIPGIPAKTGIQNSKLRPQKKSLSVNSYPKLIKELEAYFKGDLKRFKQKIKFAGGTSFEQKVWLALNEIPYGETRSYKWIAGRAGSPKAVRAAGQALKKNPLPIILPCHRVIASDGSIGGFSCGVEIKRQLLEHERSKRIDLRVL